MFHNVLAVFLFVFILPFNAGAESKFVQLKTAIHISSTISDGKHSLHEIAEIAKENGISAVIFTDKSLMRWQYGLWPFQNVIKKTVASNSILRYGPKRYLEQISQIQKEFPGMILVPGIDSAPFYYWHGSLFKRTLKILNWHKHLISLGIEDADVYHCLPVTGNTKALRGEFDIFKLWPLITLFMGIFFLNKRIYGYKDAHGRKLGPHSGGYRLSGAVIIAVSILFILNNWPFAKVRFENYRLDYGSAPYQNFIDYIDREGGVSFWTHPEAENVSRRGNVGIETTEYSYELFNTNNYTGFTIFPEGYHKIGVPGGMWDELLIQYCRGLREKPVWAIGGLAFDMKGSLAEAMKNLQTVVLTTGKTKESLLNALRSGKMYVVKGNRSQDFSLDNFFIIDESGKTQGFSGDDIDIEGGPNLYIEGKFKSRQEEVEIKIIKRGEIVKVYKHKTPFRIIYQDNSGKEEKTYYRIEIKGKGLHLITNPIFVR